MTNIAAVIVFSITTNWTTVSTTFPAPCGQVGCLVYHGGAVDNQVGTVFSNSIVRFKHEGKCFDTVVKSEAIQNNLCRTVERQ